MRGYRGLTRLPAKTDARQCLRFLPLGLVAACGVLIPVSVRAQVAGNIAVTSNEVFRGETVTGDAPAVSAGVSLDGPGGFFAGASATLAVRDGHPLLAAATEYVGYALRRSDISMELGVIHRHYARLVDVGYRRGFFEGYAGLSRRNVKLRVYVSPDYLRDGRASYYAEINALLLKAGSWSLDGHAGLSLIPQDIGSASGGVRNYEDWRLQVSRPLGRLFLSAGVAGTNYPVYDASGKPRVYTSASIAF